MIEIVDLEKKYGDTSVLKNINMVIGNGEFVSIMGASGSGKTTLLNCISTIDTPTKGDIIYDGKKITDLKEKDLRQLRADYLSFVFQDYNLLDKLDVFDNIALKLTLFNAKYSLIKEKVYDISKQLQIEHILNKYPCQISGGEKQRVAIARAMVGRPQLLIADEPTGALDSISSDNIMRLISEINAENKISVLLVTHDEYVASYAKKVVFIKDGYIKKELYKDDDVSQKKFYESIVEVSKYDLDGR